MVTRPWLGRVRFAVGGLAAVIVAFALSVMVHELVHVVQGIIRGNGILPMRFNPLMDPETCRGRLACVGGGDHHAGRGTFWGGESLAYTLQILYFIPVYVGLLRYLVGRCDS